MQTACLKFPCTQFPPATHRRLLLLHAIHHLSVDGRKIFFFFFLNRLQRGKKKTKRQKREENNDDHRRIKSTPAAVVECERRAKCPKLQVTHTDQKVQISGPRASIHPLTTHLGVHLWLTKGNYSADSMTPDRRRICSFEFWKKKNF